MDNDKLIELKVLGITRNQVQMGAYILLLEEKDGARRMPIVVGMTEAQAIAVHLEGIMPSRPLTHDLMTSMMHAYGIELQRVVINSFDNGVFTSLMSFIGSTGRVEIDSRTSDAISLALRVGAPVFTTVKVFEASSYDAADDKGDLAQKPLEKLSTRRLQTMMQKCIDSEDYEMAARLQKVIKSRTIQ